MTQDFLCSPQHPFMSGERAGRQEKEKEQRREGRGEEKGWREGRSKGEERKCLKDSFCTVQIKNVFLF